MAWRSVYLGPDALSEEKRKNKHVVFTLGTGKPLFESRVSYDNTNKFAVIEGGEAINLGEKDKKEAKNAEEKTVQIELPDNYEDAWDIVHRFEKGDPVNESISDSVGHCAFRGAGSLLDEKWSGTEDSERLAFVQEELYIHTKLMIVDDLRVIMGSANLNDRSQNGDHDSEIALVVEDLDFIETTMDGKRVSSFPYILTFGLIWIICLSLVYVLSICFHTS